MKALLNAGVAAGACVIALSAPGDFASPTGALLGVGALWALYGLIEYIFRDYFRDKLVKIEAVRADIARTRDDLKAQQDALPAQQAATRLAEDACARRDALDACLGEANRRLIAAGLSPVMLNVNTNKPT